MATSYPYGTKGAPTVGNNLGGLPRRIEPVTTAPAVVEKLPSNAYAIATFNGLADGSFNNQYSPVLITTYNYSDGYTSGNLFYTVRSKYFSYLQQSQSMSSEFAAKVKGTYTTWKRMGSGSYVTNIHVLKHDLSGGCSMNAACYGSSADTACMETVDGVDIYYYLNYLNSKIHLTKITPNYVTTPQNQSPDYAVAFSSGNRVPRAMFVNNDYLYVVSRSNNEYKIIIDKFNKSNLTAVDSKSFLLNFAPSNASGNWYAETKDTIAFLLRDASTNYTVDALVIDKKTATMRWYSDSAGSQSPTGRLLSDGNNIYVVRGGGSGGSYGWSRVAILTAYKTIEVGFQSYSGATFSLSSSILCPVENGYSWGSYVNTSGTQVSGMDMVFVPKEGVTFGFSGGSWYFSQSWDVYDYTPTAASTTYTTISSTSVDTGFTFTPFNPFGKTII